MSPTRQDTNWNPEAAHEVLAPFREEHDVLMALQAVQHRFGHVPDEAIPLVAAACNVSRADVHGVRTFYTDLRADPPAACVVRVCLGEACQAVGARSLLAATRELAGAVPAAELEVSTVACLGNCALGPTAIVDGRLVGRATTEVVKRLVEQARGTSA